MKYKIALLTFFLAFGAAQYAAAEDHPDVVYQKELLARSLPAPDKAICDDKAGAAKTPAYDSCHVTRLFISDINAGKEKGFPPLTNIKYTVNKPEKGKKTEKDEIMDRM